MMIGQTLNNVGKDKFPVRFLKLAIENRTRNTIYSAFLQTVLLHTFLAQVGLFQPQGGLFRSNFNPKNHNFLMILLLFFGIFILCCFIE